MGCKFCVQFLYMVLLYKNIRPYIVSRHQFAPYLFAIICSSKAQCLFVVLGFFLAYGQTLFDQQNPKPTTQLWVNIFPPIQCLIPMLMLVC